MAGHREIAAVELTVPVLLSVGVAREKILIDPLSGIGIGATLSAEHDDRITTIYEAVWNDRDVLPIASKEGTALLAH